MYTWRLLIAWLCELIGCKYSDQITVQNTFSIKSSDSFIKSNALDGVLSHKDSENLSFCRITQNISLGYENLIWLITCCKMLQTYCPLVDSLNIALKREQHNGFWLPGCLCVTVIEILRNSVIIKKILKLALEIRSESIHQLWT